MTRSIKEDFDEKDHHRHSLDSHDDDGPSNERPDFYPAEAAEELQPEAIERTTTRDHNTSALSRIITGRSITSTRQDPGPPPDGGLDAWLQVAMGHLVIFNTWGYISSFGVFQSYYTETLNRPPADISWVGSIQIFLLFFIGTAAGRATDAGFFRPVFVTGFVLQLIGTFMTSLSTKYWQLFLAQGVCTGLGNGLQFAPTMTLITTYFAKRRSSALGVVASGSATGGIVYSVLVRQLLPKLGFGTTVRVLGFVTMGTGLISIAFLRTRLPPRKAGPLVEWSAFKEIPYTLYCIGMFLNFWSLYFAFYYVGSFGRNMIGVSYEDSINYLLILNSVGYPGRLIPNYLADKYFGPLNSIIPFSFLSGIMFFAWSGVSNRGGLIAFSAFYGLSAAGIQSLFPATLSSLTSDLRKAGTRLGMGFTIVSFAALTGPSVAGALITNADGKYLDAQMWAGTMMLCGCFTLIAARVVKVGWRFKVKI
ncbi:MFS general substrate transporter [Pseudovirgaria hyperparasitica]|uniref:MFS general substrate transporter n=1 Tax=Pseudovirgaria hyperparasitica TaxID=470096 RepID=A0A6A6VSN8_9PEZI|nr:MFS general substrate transporter [Pseudovirgaria hyperparasitica]KAF2753602.1 MFS general substrate transporter [Pseudovirgaria hyperparasitica]